MDWRMFITAYQSNYPTTTFYSSIAIAGRVVQTSPYPLLYTVEGE